MRRCVRAYVYLCLRVRQHDCVRVCVSVCRVHVFVCACVYATVRACVCIFVSAYAAA